MNPTSLSLQIRDGLEPDIARCLALDHSYQTDRVWQMQVSEDGGTWWEIAFKNERLPRMMETTHPSSLAQLKASLPKDQGFLVAVLRGSDNIIGYLTLSPDAVHGIGRVHDLVVDRTYRRQHVGTRLLAVARTWAREHDLTRLMVEATTKNYPGILFYQKMGFVWCGFNDRYFANQDIALFLNQSLR